ncbi:iron chelate uptake ABC transporter family permease subunit [uncultured Vibrio sp.]|uniref:FecCD family ABC transporter permease n=1 Tax=uncultured Vibrio sp. TaxID=114054 RepID=UPI002AA6F961|nr:iron chelate uptake ABC transporter family permease subunit [uncultured Vibrio sp.]
MSKVMRSTVLSDQLIQLKGVTIRYSRKEWLFVGSALIALALMGLYLLTVGSYPLTFEKLFTVLAGQNNEPIAERIVWNIRMPRVVTALFVGIALGVSGAVFQSVSKNALGSPDIIGFTTGAASGALIQIIIFQSSTQTVMLSAVLGGIVTAVIVYFLAKKHSVVGGYRLILIGIGIGSILNALNGLMLVKGNLDQAIIANLWLAGSLNARNWSHAIPVMVGVLFIVPIVIYKARTLHLLEMGDDMAAQIGVSVERERLVMTFLSVALAALATAAAGPIGFIALAAPQLVIRILRVGHIPVAASAVMGGGLLLVADMVSQTKPFGFNLPIGQLTSLVGGAYLLWLLTRSKSF